jgi:membrane-associated phospholipid phosphatase
MALKKLYDRSFPHERLFAAYLLIIACLLLFFGSPVADRWMRAGWHVSLAAIIVFVFPLAGERGWLGGLRHWIPIALLAVAYTELRYLNHMFSSTFHDESIVALEQSVFGAQWSVVLRGWLPYRPLSEYLHFAYFSYYFLFPILGIALFLKGKLEEYRYAATVVLTTFFLCYLIFIVFPVAGPWNHFPRPTLDEVGHFAPSLVHSVLIAGESVGTAFPSSHVAAALTVWLSAARVDRGTFRLQAFLVPALIIGTMYGGFHYAVDVVVGIGVALAVTAMGPAIHRFFGGNLVAAAATVAAPASATAPGGMVAPGSVLPAQDGLDKP